MAKQLNVNLAFTADTSKAKAQLQDLQKQLTEVVNLSTKKAGGEILAQDIEKASKAAAELKTYLEDATNVKTGKLDLGKLSEALDTKKLKSYRNSLQAIGVEGQKAFMMLAQSITDAEVPLRRTSNLMSELWVTMKNTARWQLTSSAMHGFMSAVSSAYGYAQDLNESLNNIRIVSGQDTEQMAKFAEKANKAAKALNTTTTNYTNAALIYYQQGLSDSEIEERTDITIKMANVARQSAEVVSDQLTAVWNNFYKKGEEGLAYYADIMTALGAETASSTDEIAAGLEKFASIADMIGLSFEYAASSLATITATTRQSPEVVGTALKTIFARIQGLKLGETLEDGTDLNKYSDSLKRVGIEIFDTAGELKDMDIILEEIGNRWDQLGKNEQVALAQAVAGVRQYNQLVSLMDHWDYFQENLGVARNSEGALDEQVKIFEESWEGASNRVRAAMESIYSDIIKDDAFIDMLNNVENIITGVDKLIESVGGLNGVLSALGVVATRVFHEQMSASLKNIAYSMDMSFGLGKEKAQELQKAAWKETENFEVDTGTFEGNIKSDLIREQSKLQQSFIKNSSKMSQEEIKVNQVLLDRNKILTDIIGKRANEITELENAEKQERTNLELEIRRRKKHLSAEKIKSFTSDFKNTSRWSGRMLTGLSLEELEKPEKQGLNYDELYNFFEKNSWGGVLNKSSIDIIENLFKNYDEDYIVSFNEISDAIFARQLNAEEEFAYLSGLDDKKIQEMVKQNHAIAEGYIEITRSGEKVKVSMEELSNSFTKAKGTQKDFTDVIISSANAISSAVFTINALKTAFDTLNNPDMSGLDKFLSISMTLVSVIPMLSSGMKSLQEIFSLETLEITKNTAAQIINTLAVEANIAEVKKQGKAVEDTGKEIIENTDVWTKQTGGLLLKLISNFKPLLGKFALVAAAIFILIKAFEHLYAISPEGIFKSAQEQADNAAEAFSRVTAQVDDLKNSLDGLESSYDKIENLTEGTLEWYQAVADVNAEVLKLKDEYSNLDIFRDEKGILRITEESQEKVLEEQTKRFLAAQGAKLQADKSLLEAEYNVEKENIKFVGDQTQNEVYSDFHLPERTGKIGQYNQTDLVDAAAQYYNHPLVGEGLFSSRAGAEALAEGIYGITEVDEGYEDIVNSLYELIQNNETQITKLAEMQAEIDNYDKFILDSHLDVIGTNRSSEELGINYTEEFDKAKEQAAEKFKNEGGWQDHFNYTDQQVENNEALQDFMAMQGGENVEYVANKNGKLVLNIDGEEEEFTEEYVYNSLAELEISNTLKKTVVEKIKGTLNEAINEGVKDSVISLDNLSEDQIIGLDNFHQAIQNKFDSELVGEEERTEPALAKAQEEANALTSTIVDAYGAEGLDDFLATIEGIDLTSNIDNIRIFNTEIDRLKQGLDEGDPKALERFTHSMEKLSTIGEIDNLKSLFESEGKSLGLSDEEISSMQDYAKYIAKISEESEVFSEQLATNANRSADLAIEITRMNKGVKTLGENFAVWNDILKKSTKESAEYMEAMVATKNALADVLDVESDLISNEFIENNLDQIKKASEGNAEAIDALRAKMDEEIILRVSVDKDEETKAQINALNDTLQSLVPENIEIGMELRGTDEAYADFVSAANDIVKKAGMTADEANAYFAGIGYEPVYSITDVDATQSLPNTRTKTVLTGIGYEEGPQVDIGPFGSFNIPQPSFQYDTYTEPLPPTKAEGDVPLVAFKGDGTPPDIKGLVRKATGAQNNYSASNAGGPKSTKGKGKGGKGGGGSKVKKTKRSDVVDRYKEITDQLDDVQDAASDTAKEMDRLYGANRLKAIDKQNSLIQKEISLLKAKRTEALNYLKIDRKALEVAAKKAGVNLEIGADGNIANYTTVLNSLFNQLEAAENAAGETADEAEQKKIEAIQEKIEELKSAISQYDETRELLEDLDNELEDKFNEWQDNNYEKLTYSLELKLEINDMELERIDYFLNKFADNFYKMAESAGLLMGQIEPNTSNIEENKIHKDELDTAYQAGEISQADYIEGLKNVRQNLYSTLEALNELDKTMLHYYEDTLAAATSELADHTDHMEHLTSVFEHYINLMNILGKSKNYDAIGDFLGGKADTIRDRLEVAKSYYNMLLEQKEDVEAKLNMAIARGDDAAIELYREEWDAIVDEVDAAQEEVLSLTEEWSEAMKAVIENNMAKIAETLEKTLTNGINFDELMDGFDKLNTRQEEYLTKTNQIYETNKLMRTANKALDETDNAVAKQKLKNFIEETKSLQNNTKLSEYELEIQKAKYDLLLAEIALEEAQNAKSTVRMSKDNEGNFGYVFTADQDEIDDAQQGVDDAKNRLYNLSLEGQQEYTQKYLQAQQEMYNELTNLQQIYLDGQIASEEEYNRRKEEILNHYLNPVDGILSTYSHLFNIAVQTDADATADYWAKDYAQMTQNTEEWKIAVNEYLVEVEEETDEWKRVSEQANNDVQNALENSSEATRELTEESEYLAEITGGEVVDALEAELDAVAAITEGYANQRAELLRLIDETEKYLSLLGKQIEREAKYTSDTDFAAELIKGGIGDMSVDDAKKIAEYRAQKQGLKGEAYNTAVQNNMNIYFTAQGASAQQKEELNKAYNINKQWTNTTFKDIMGLSTGGYTGAWGPEGKLAVLHEKELVLNADDTSNLLAVVSFVRDLVGIIDSQAQMQGLTNISPISTISNMNQTLEQQVSIHAEFPNATDRFEIEEAFSSLVNRASQYANRK